MEFGLLGCVIALRDDEDAEDEPVVVAEIPI